MFMFCHTYLVVKSFLSFINNQQQDQIKRRSVPVFLHPCSQARKGEKIPSLTLVHDKILLFMDHDILHIYIFIVGV